VTADLAFVLKPASVERAREILALEGVSTEHRPLIGVSLSRVISRWAFPALRDRNEKYRAYLEIMAQMIDRLADQMSATIVFIPQVIGPTPELDDRLAAKDIYAVCKNKAKIKLIANEYRPEELRAITGEFDMFIGTRTHAVISAAVMGVPFLALEYESHKTRGIIGRMLQCEDLVYDIRELSLETLHRRIDEVWKNRDRIRMELASKTATMEKRALRNGELVAQLVKEQGRC
jgi:colanic acid/amylovoran biosynthesis protein